MRISSALTFLTILLSATASTAGGSLSVPVGEVATLVHLETQGHRISGETMGTVSLDTASIRRDCEANGNFSGIIRLKPIRQSMGMDDWGRLRVEVDCLGPPS